VRAVPFGATPCREERQPAIRSHDRGGFRSSMLRPARQEDEPLATCGFDSIKFIFPVKEEGVEVTDDAGAGGTE
jgi:hypothetical protein